MAESLCIQNTQEDTRNISTRRKKIAAFLAASSLFIMGIVYEGGFRLLPTSVNTESKSYEELSDRHDGNAFILTESFLYENGVYEYSHRAGNTIESIDEAVEKGANIFDMDINDVDGELYGEHGLVYKENILGVDFTMVIDPNEAEIRTKTPTKFEDLIKHIASLSTQDRPLAVYTEFKFGLFKDETLMKMIDILLKYHVPAIIRPGESRGRLETIRALYNANETAYPLNP